MKRADWFQLGAFAFSASVAVGGAFLASSRFLGRARAQESFAPGGASSAQAVPSDDGVSSPALTPPQQTQPPGGAAPQVDNFDPAAMAAKAGSGIAQLEGFLEPFIYDIVNRRDPFQPYGEFLPKEESGTQAPLSPAQRWDLEQLKLIGIMWDVKDPKAMFLDPEDDVMILGRDQSIGNRHGYIAAIREGEVVVVEAIRKRGDIIYRTRVLRIER